MDQRRLEWKVGLFVLVGLTVLAVLILQFSKITSILHPSYALHLTAKNVGGLKPRANVLMAGVQIGTVSEITLNSEGKDVNITLQIFKQFKIRKNARIVIEQYGFLGDQYVAIVPLDDQGPFFAPGDNALVQEPFNLQEVARSALGFIQRIDETAKKLNAAISDVRRLVLNEETLTNISDAARIMRQASGRALDTMNEINVLVETNGPSIALAVSNVVFFSDQINGFADKFGEVLTTNSTEINVAVKNIEASTEVLKSLLDDLHAGKGLAGSVLRDEEMAQNFQLIASNLSITTSNLNRNGLWGILWSKKPPKSKPPAEAPPRTESPKTAK